VRLEGRTALAGALAAMALGGCVHRVMDFKIMATRNVDLSKVASLRRGPERSTGEDRAYVVFVVPTAMPHVEEAVERALRKVPGAVALVDGTVYEKNAWFVAFGWSSYVVEGTPLIDPALAGPGSAPTSDFTESHPDPAR